MHQAAKLLGVLACCFTTTGAASAYCPERIATIEGTPMNTALLPVMEDLYGQLGCQLTTVAFPGRRGVAAFNAKRVSGELFRLPVIEPSYQTEFVRSAAPVFHFQEALWLHPSRHLDRTSKIGYVIGLKWQETFAKNNAARHQFVKYSSSRELFSDYEHGLLDGFLSGPLQVETQLKDKVFSKRPEMALFIRKTPVYHYLDSRYATFMADLSRIIKDQSTINETGAKPDQANH